MDRNERQSVLRVPPIPDGTVSQADRKHITGLYAGIGAAIDDLTWRIIRGLAVAVGSITDSDSYTSTDWDILDNITTVVGEIADDDSYNSTDFDIIDDLTAVIGAA